MPHYSRHAQRAAARCDELFHAWLSGIALQTAAPKANEAMRMTLEPLNAIYNSSTFHLRTIAAISE